MCGIESNTVTLYATLGLALGTFALAAFTGWLVYESRMARQSAYRPTILVEPPGWRGWTSLEAHVNTYNWSPVPALHIRHGSPLNWIIPKGNPIPQLAGRDTTGTDVPSWPCEYKIEWPATKEGAVVVFEFLYYSPLGEEYLTHQAFRISGQRLVMHGRPSITRIGWWNRRLRVRWPKS